MRNQIRFEGLTANEALAVDAEEIDALVLSRRPIVFTVGSARVLGSFGVKDRVLDVELAQIDGGGEGVLLAVAALCRRFARQRSLDGVNGIVHAVACAHPNLKLRRVLERRGFAIRDLPDVGKVYHRYQAAGAE